MARAPHLDPPRELFELAESRWIAGDLEAAQTLFRATAITATALADHARAFDAWSMLARCYWYESEPRQAEHCFERAAESAKRQGLDSKLCSALLKHGFLAYDSGDLAEAERRLGEVAAMPCLDDSCRGLLAGYRGNVARTRAKFVEARAYYADASEALTLAESNMETVFAMDLAVVELLDGDPSAALQQIESARQRMRAREPITEALFEHYGRLARWALGSAFTPPNDLSSEGTPFQRFVQLCATTIANVDREAFGPSHLTTLRSAAPPGEHARLTLRIIRAAIEHVDSYDGVLRVDRHLCRASLGDELEVQLTPASAEWRVFLALVEKHGHAMTSEALIACGWPGERIEARAARNRLHVALSALRRKGLRELLLRDGDGYTLSPALSVVYVDGP